MKLKYLVILFFFTSYISELFGEEAQNKIVLKVGNEIITSYEIKNKILTNLILNNIDITQNNIDKAKNQSLQNLIDLRLKTNELKKEKIKVEKRRIDSYLAQLNANKDISLKEKLGDSNLNYSLFVDEIETELKWQKFIFKKYSKKIETAENLIINEIDEILKKNTMKREVNLSEIEILRSDFDSENKLISNILNEIKQNGFENTALKFSISSSAIKKGNLGWLNENILSKNIFEVVNKMKLGDISKPILQSEKILFLKLNNERQATYSDIEKEKLKKNLIKKKQNEIFNLYSSSHLSLIRNKYITEYK